MFRVGSLVSLGVRYSLASVFASWSNEDRHIPVDDMPTVGYMNPGDTALVLEVHVDPKNEWADGVRVVGPFGIGWVNGDMLREVR